MLKKWQISALEAIDGWGEFVSNVSHKNSAENRIILINMARNGEPRPVGIKSRLGKCLIHYTSKNNRGTIFDVKIRKLAPHWFTDTATENKNRLIAMAKEKRPKPRKCQLGTLLSNYTQKSSSSYDPEFDKIIREIVPQWFIPDDRVLKKKMQLLELARSGADRPRWRKTGNLLMPCLQLATNKNSKYYDPDFDAKIRALAPHWFVKKRSVIEKRRELIAIARRGEKRPTKTTNPELASALCHYTCQKKNGKGYNEAFDKQIRNIRPDWFK